MGEHASLAHTGPPRLSLINVLLLTVVLPRSGTLLALPPKQVLRPQSRETEPGGAISDDPHALPLCSPTSPRRLGLGHGAEAKKGERRGNLPRPQARNRSWQTDTFPQVTTCITVIHTH